MCYADLKKTEFLSGVWMAIFIKLFKTEKLFLVNECTYFLWDVLVLFCIFDFLSDLVKLFFVLWFFEYAFVDVKKKFIYFQ